MKSAAELRQEAEREVRELQLDCDVRDAARAGVSDGGANWYHSIDTGVGMLDVHATFGAGTNSAHVLDCKRGFDVYSAHDYGKHLVAYRRGTWVDLIRAVAIVYRDRTAANQLCDSVSKDRSEAERFTPMGEGE